MCGNLTSSMNIAVSGRMQRTGRRRISEVLEEGNEKSEDQTRGRGGLQQGGVRAWWGDHTSVTVSNYFLEALHTAKRSGSTPITTYSVLLVLDSALAQSGRTRFSGIQAESKDR